MTTSTPREAHEPGPQRRPTPPRPVTPADAVSTCLAADDHGTMYAPTSMNACNSSFIEVWCPMEYGTGFDNMIVVTLGGTNNSLDLWFSDDALIKFTRTMNEATRAMLRSRGIPIPEGIGERAER